MKRQIAFLGLIAALLSAGNAKGQCQTGDGFVVCPGADQIYINTDKRLAALRLLDGGIQWQIDLPPREDSYLAGAANLDTVAVWAGFPDTGIYAFDANTGKPLWHVDTSSYGVISVRHYFLFSDAEHWEALTAVDDRTGRRIWHHSGDRPTRGGVDFLDFNDGAIITEFFAIDARSGQILVRWPRTWYVSGAALSGKFVVISNRYAGPKISNLVLYSLPDYRLAWMKKEPPGRDIAALASDSDRIFAAVCAHRGAALVPDPTVTSSPSVYREFP